VRKKLFKKITATVLSLTLVMGMANVVSAAHAANGANVASSISWSWFSVLPIGGEETLDETHNGHTSNEDGTRQHPYCWYHALTHINTDSYPNGQTPGTDFATKGYVASGTTASSAQFFCSNTGWDGQYNDRDGSLVGDNPWGLRFYSSSIPVEKGRSYTLSFKYTSTLKGTNTVYEKNDDGEYVLDENGDKIPVKNDKNQNVTEVNYKKHIGFNVINPATSSGLDFTSYSGCSADGYFLADAEKEDDQTITVSFTVPTNYAGTSVSIQFVCGSYLVSYPEELAMSGSLFIKDLKMLAGTQYTVKYTYNNQAYTQYVNAGAAATGHVFPVAGKTFVGYKKGSTNYNLSTPVNADTNLTVVYTNTKKPAKVKVKYKAQKKKVKLTLTKNSNCVGFQIKYGSKKNMKGATTRYTTKKNYTVKKLASGMKTFFQVRGYNVDSAGKKVISNKVNKKTVIVK
jgi:hypothetical protein